MTKHHEPLPRVEMPKQGKVGKKIISALEAIINKVYRGEKRKAGFGPPSPSEKYAFVWAPQEESWCAKISYYPPDKKNPTPLYSVDISFPYITPGTEKFAKTPDLVFYALPIHLKDHHGYQWQNSEPYTGKHVDNDHRGLHVAYNSLESFRKGLPHVLGLVRQAALRFCELTEARNNQFSEALDSILKRDEPRVRRK